jgi:hypothetical protein
MFFIAKKPYLIVIPYLSHSYQKFLNGFTKVFIGVLKNSMYLGLKWPLFQVETFTTKKLSYLVCPEKHVLRMG